MVRLYQEGHQDGTDVEWIRNVHKYFVPMESLQMERAVVGLILTAMLG
jgi:hypothetical protein